MISLQAAIQEPILAHPQILLLEDEPSVARGLQMVLTQDGLMDVDLVMNGRKALETYKNKAFDLMIADLRLPDIDGMEVIKRVRHDRPDIGVIVITGYSSVSTAVEAMKIGALDYLPKPFTEDELMTSVKEALVHKKDRLAVPAPAPQAAAARRERPELRLIPDEQKTVDDLMAQVRTYFAGRPEEVIPMLQFVQQRLGYLAENALEEIARYARRSSAEVFGVATFYEQFRFAPAGRHTVRVCRGTACHVKGSDRILDEFEKRFHLIPGKTTPDRAFTLETVACFGSCAIAPVVVIDQEVQGRMNPPKACDLLAGIRDKESDSI